MAGFYRALHSADQDGNGSKESRDKLEAFVTARRRLRERLPAPYHWAPFVYIGEAR
jgi:CHAT domain-containing protein